jgi:amino acid efflux transporter
MSAAQDNKIGLATATIIGINAMIGSGIFTAPATIATNIGPAGIIAYLFVVAAVWFMALSLSRLAMQYPEEGSFYTYTKPWAGHIGGLIAGGLYLIGLVVAMGLLSRVAGNYLHHVIPSLSVHTLGLCTLLSIIILNLFGVAFSQFGQYVLFATTLLPLIATTILCFFHTDLSNLTPFAPYGFTNVFKTTRVVIFGFFGFESAASLFSVVKKPAQNVPRALTYSILVVGTIYTLFISSMIASIPMALFANPETPLSEIIAHLIPGNIWIINIIHFAILSAIIGTIHSMVWGASMLLLDLAKKANHNIKTYAYSIPKKATRIAVLAIGAGIYLAFDRIDNLDLFFFITSTCIVSAFIFSMMTLLFNKKEWQTLNIITTLLGVATAFMILYFSIEGLIFEIISMMSN